MLSVVDDAGCGVLFSAEDSYIHAERYWGRLLTVVPKAEFELFAAGEPKVKNDLQATRQLPLRWSQRSIELPDATSWQFVFGERLPR